MRYEPINLGFSTADGEEVRFAFDGSTLRLDFIDWHEKPVTVAFEDVLGVHWGQDLPPGAPRDDMPFEVIDSEWLLREGQLNAISDLHDYAHYLLCFNACGNLDVLCRKVRRS